MCPKHNQAPEQEINGKDRAKGTNGKLRNSPNIDLEISTYKLIFYKFLFHRQIIRKDCLKYYVRQWVEG